MADVASVILRRLEYLQAQVNEEASEAAWIQFCEVLALAWQFHEDGLLSEPAMSRVRTLEDEAIRRVTARKGKGSCRMTA